MAHSDAGRYAAKHAPGGSPDERIAEEVREKARQGELSCAEAERIGAALGVKLEEVGRTLDLLEIRIGRCQLGLFGYGPEGEVGPAGGVGCPGSGRGDPPASRRWKAPLQRRLGDCRRR